MSEQEKAIEGSRQYVCAREKWVIDEDTFQVLDRERCVWIARVTTAHLSKGGQPEQAFLVLVCYANVFTLEESSLPALLDWCLKMSAKGAGDE